MRIAMLAPLEMRVPPVAYGGTELVVSLLTEELVRRGHDVTLFASGDSVTAADLHAVHPSSLRGTPAHRGVLNLMNAAACIERTNGVDIVHNHSEYEGLVLGSCFPAPVLTTLHGTVQGDLVGPFLHYNGWYNTLSQAAKRLLPEKERFAGVVYNSIDVDSYPFDGSQARSSDLLFLSRISPEKGPHFAIQVAKRAGRRLIIAGNVADHDEEYFRTQVLPQVDGDQIQYVGEADYALKRYLLPQAACLLAPITWPEPFGLFMIEAMACGTPVIAFDRGSVREVVDDGKTGFIVHDVAGMVAALEELGQISAVDCRSHVRQHFDVARMADDYLATYEYVVRSDGLTQPSRREPAGPREREVRT